MPAREFHILRLHIAFEAEGELRGQFAVDLICRAGFDGLEGVKHIRLHHDELGNTIEHDGIAQCDQVYPAAAAFATRYGTELMPYATHGCPRLVKQLRWERTGAYARAVCLEDTKYLANLVRCNTQAGACACADGVRRGNKGIRTKVHIQQRPLCALA